jgi:hypothetical protein
MEALLAGWIAGYAVSVVFTLAGTLLLARRPTPDAVAPAPASSPAPGLRASRLGVAVAVSIGGFLGWTLVGLVLGAAYDAAGGNARAALGSPAIEFTAVVVAVTAIVTATASLVLRRVAWQVVAIASTAAACFGWLLPNLADRGTGGP